MSVYFARVRGYVKVGYSADPVKRIQTVARHRSALKPCDISPDDHVDLLGFYRGSRLDERRAHVALEAHRAVGEWFWDDPEVEAFARSQPEYVDVTTASLYEVCGVLDRGLTVAQARSYAHAMLTRADTPFTADFIARIKAENRAARASERLAYRSARAAA